MGVDAGGGDGAVVRRVAGSDANPYGRVVVMGEVEAKATVGALRKLDVVGRSGGGGRGEHVVSRASSSGAGSGAGGMAGAGQGGVAPVRAYGVGFQEGATYDARGKVRSASWTGYHEASLAARRGEFKRPAVGQGGDLVGKQASVGSPPRRPLGRQVLLDAAGETDPARVTECSVAGVEGLRGVAERELSAFTALVRLDVSDTGVSLEPLGLRLAALEEVTAQCIATTSLLTGTPTGTPLGGGGDLDLYSAARDAARDEEEEVPRDAAESVSPTNGRGLRVQSPPQTPPAGMTASPAAPRMRTPGVIFTFAGFRNLVKLDLAFNRVTPETLVALAGLPKLTQLNLKRNELRVIPAACAAGFGALARLDLADNVLHKSCLPVLAVLPRLRVLGLANNRISRVPARVRRIEAADGLMAPSPSPSTSNSPGDGASSIAGGGTSETASDAGRAAPLASLEIIDLSYNNLCGPSDVEALAVGPRLRRVMLHGNPMAGHSSKSVEGRAVEQGLASIRTPHGPVSWFLDDPEAPVEVPPTTGEILAHRGYQKLIDTRGPAELLRDELKTGVLYETVSRVRDSEAALATLRAERDASTARAILRSPSPGGGERLADARSVWDMDFEHMTDAEISQFNALLEVREEDVAGLNKGVYHPTVGPGGGANPGRAQVSKPHVSVNRATTALRFALDHPITVVDVADGEGASRDTKITRQRRESVKASVLHRARQNAAVAPDVRDGMSNLEGDVELMKRRLEGVSDELLRIVAENDLGEFEDFGPGFAREGKGDKAERFNGDDSDPATVMDDILGKASRGDRPSLA